jgi:hypothetical protein
VVSRFIHENPIFIVILTIILLIFFFWLLLWKLPQWQVTAVQEVKDRIDLELKSRQTLAQILGGTALLVGLYFTSQTLRTTQEGQITDRFTKAIDQLGKEEAVAVRLGGIYALERIARDSASDHWAVMEVLTAFIRERAPAKTLPPEETSEERETNEDLHERKLPTDIQAILTVIGRRTQTFGNGESSRLNLRRTKLQEANLIEANLSGADLSGADLSGADLSGADLSGADLHEADLHEANLSGADLSGADLSKAYLSGANLQGAQNFTQDQINSACIDENSRLPEGLRRAAPCPTKP